MVRNIIIKSAIVLLVLAVAYGVLWYFKVGQLEKQINNFVSENSSNVSIGELSVSGFPFSQKIVVKDFKFSIPASGLGKRKVHVKHFEAKSEGMSTDFVVSAIENVVFEAVDGSEQMVEFVKTPEIKFSVAEGRISQFSYVDQGYKVLGSDKTVIYSAESSNVTLDAVSEAGDKIILKIKVNVAGMSGFDAIDLYKNAAEAKVIQGIKTGEISLAAQVAANGAEVTASGQPMATVINSAVSSLVAASNPADVQKSLDNINASIQSQMDLSKQKAAAGAVQVAAQDKSKATVSVIADAKAGSVTNSNANAVKVDNVTTTVSGSASNNPTAAPAASSIANSSVAPVTNSVVNSAVVNSAVTNSAVANSGAPAAVSANLPVKAPAVAVDANKAPLPATVPMPAQVAGASQNSQVPASVTANQAPIAPAVVGAPAVANAPAADVAAQTAANASQNVDTAKAVEAIKGNLMFELQYILTPVQNSSSQAVIDPTQINMATTQYNKTVKILNLEFSNQFYKVSVNGEFNIFQDDGFPSGSVSFRIEKLDNLINYLVTNFNTIANPEPSTSDQTSAVALGAVDEKQQYFAFLKRFSANLSSVSKEVVQKNSVSNNDVAVLDIRREKNLEFLVNETPLREVMGKF